MYNEETLKRMDELKEKNGFGGYVLDIKHPGKKCSFYKCTNLATKRLIFIPDGVDLSCDEHLELNIKSYGNSYPLYRKNVEKEVKKQKEARERQLRLAQAQAREKSDLDEKIEEKVYSLLYERSLLERIGSGLYRALEVYLILKIFHVL